MKLLRRENSSLPYSPVVIANFDWVQFIGITRSQLKLLDKECGIKEDILLRKPRHILSLDSEFTRFNGKDVAHICAFISAANAQLLKLEQGPQMFLKSLCLEVV